MKSDKVFGPIEWTGELWTGTLALPYFQGAGKRVALTPADRKELPPSGQCTLNIETNEKRRPPSESQRKALEQIQKRGGQLWDEAMDALCAEYQRQRPNRVRYWKVLQGQKNLNRSLPATVERAVMKELVLPMWCYVQEPDEQHQTVDVYLTLMSTWWSESINVYIRDGKVTEVTAFGDFVNRKWPRIETAAFGTLRRSGGGEVWGGGGATQTRTN